MAWAVTEKAPEITAWLAMTVARPARITRGTRAQAGAIRKKGFSKALASDSSSAPLAEIVEDEGRQDQQIPGQADRRAAEMPHIGVERFAAGHGKNHRSQGQESGEAMVVEEHRGVVRTDGGQHQGGVGDVFQGRGWQGW